MTHNKDVRLINFLRHKLYPLVLQLKQQLLQESECLRKLDDHALFKIMKQKQNTIAKLVKAEKEFFRLINYDSNSPFAAFLVKYIHQHCTAEYQAELSQVWQECRQKLQTTMRQNNINDSAVAPSIERTENQLLLLKPSSLECVSPAASKT
jgi:flagellar biosynthesis/type III secretory pathway chaperone